jgi:hypothetical protein
MTYDYSEAPKQYERELIPACTIATLQLAIRFGNAGEDDLLKRSKDGACEMLDLEFTIVDGPYAKRKLWMNLVLAGTTAGHAEAAFRSRGTLKAILDSAHGLDPKDKSSQARAARTVSLKDFDGLRFVGKIGVETGKPKNDGSGQNYNDKNILEKVITPDLKEWRATEQTPPFDPPKDGGSTPPTTVNKPSWAS